MISANEIREIDFGMAPNGYDCNKVDDILDEIAADFEAMTQKISALEAQKAELQKALAEAQAKKAELEKQVPDYDEKAYFENLRASMHEALVGAQRKADQALADAKAQAQSIMEKAREEAANTCTEAQDKANSIAEAAEATRSKLAEQSGELKAQIENHRETFRKLLEDSVAVLKKFEAEK